MLQNFVKSNRMHPPKFRGDEHILSIDSSFLQRLTDLVLISVRTRGVNVSIPC